MKARNILWYVVIFLFPLHLESAESNFFIHNCSNFSTFEEKIGYIFAHGLGANQEQATLFSSSSTKWLIHKPLVVFDFPDSKNNAMEYHSTQVNLGQEKDITRLKEVHTRAQQELQDHRFILAGISRGAATIINYVALHQPDSVAALVLESPFDTLTNVIKHLLRRFHINWVPFSKKIALKLAKSNFPLLDFNGIFPINVVNKIKLPTPIFISHSRKDRTIPVNSSRNLYLSLILSGHPNVYFLELASGEHGKLVHSIESDLYTYVLHAFYKKHGLPHNTQFAQQGNNMLKYCQPSVEEISKKIRKTKNRDDFLEEDFDIDYDESNYAQSFSKNCSFELEISSMSTRINTMF